MTLVAGDVGLKCRGVTVEGRVSAIRGFMTAAAVGVGSHTDNRFAYEFEGRTFRGRATVGPRELDILYVGADVPVIIDQAKPKRYRLGVIRL
jgi:hypothetical protein